MGDIWSLLEKIHRKRKITSAASGTRETIHAASRNQMPNQQLNIDGFRRYNDNDECMKQLKQIELDMMPQKVIYLY